GRVCSVQGAGVGSAHRRCLPPQLARDALGRLPSPPPVPENLLLGLHRKLPSGTPTRRHALGRLPTPPPLPENLLLGLHRKLPSEPPASTQEVSESEVPVHVHPFAARVPSDSKGSECQCGIHTAEAASALRSRKTQRAAKEKPTPISQIF